MPPASGFGAIRPVTVWWIWTAPRVDWDPGRLLGVWLGRERGEVGRTGGVPTTGVVTDAWLGVWLGRERGEVGRTGGVPTTGVVKDAWLGSRGGAGGGNAADAASRSRLAVGRRVASARIGSVRDLRSAIISLRADDGLLTSGGTACVRRAVIHRQRTPFQHSPVSVADAARGSSDAMQFWSRDPLVSSGARGVWGLKRAARSTAGAVDEPCGFRCRRPSCHLGPRGGGPERGSAERAPGEPRTRLKRLRRLVDTVNHDPTPLVRRPDPLPASGCRRVHSSIPGVERWPGDQGGVLGWSRRLSRRGERRSSAPTSDRSYRSGQTWGRQRTSTGAVSPTGTRTQQSPGDGTPFDSTWCSLRSSLRPQRRSITCRA